MCEIRNSLSTDVTKSKLKFAIYRTADFLPYMTTLNVPHRHNYNMILLNESHSGSQLIDFKECDIHPFSITCLHYGQIHQWLDFDKIEGYIIIFENDFFALRHQNYELSEFSFLTYRHKQPYVEVSEAQFANLKSIALWMLREFTAEQNSFDKHLYSLLNLLLLELSRLFEPFSETSEFSQSLQMIYHFEELIDKYFREKHFVKDYASILHVRPNYLNAVCNEITKTSAGDLIRHRILLESKRLLIHEKKTASEIAYELGFADNSYFGRFFKKYEKNTPDGFKKMFLKR